MWICYRQNIGEEPGHVKFWVPPSEPTSGSKRVRNVSIEKPPNRLQKYYIRDFRSRVDAKACFGTIVRFTLLMRTEQGDTDIILACHFDVLLDLCKLFGFSIAKTYFLK